MKNRATHVAVLDLGPGSVDGWLLQAGRMLHRSENQGSLPHSLGPGENPGGSSGRQSAG